MNHEIAAAGLSDRVICDSAGTSSYHIGSPPDARMRSAAAQRGMQLVGSARQFMPRDFEEFDLILAMDRENYRNILSLDRQGKYGDRVKLICEYAKNHAETEVPDPYYGGPEGFDRVIDLLLDACHHLLAEIIETQNLTPAR